MKDVKGRQLKNPGRREKVRTVEECIAAVEDLFMTDNKYITHVKICEKLDISLTTLRLWMNEDERYAKLRELINYLNSERINEKALMGEYNPQYSIFLQKSKHNKIEYERQQRLDIEKSNALQPQKLEITSDIFNILKDKDIDAYK